VPGRPFQRSPRGLVQEGVKPVLSEGGGLGHFGGVEEMRGVPVGEGGDGPQVAPGRLGVALVGRLAEGQGQRAHSMQAGPADAEQADAIGDLVTEGRNLQEPVGFLKDVLDITLQERIRRLAGSVPAISPTRYRGPGARRKSPPPVTGWDRPPVH
jgi:hypothetical protein